MDNTLLSNHTRKVNKTMIGISCLFIFFDIALSILLKITIGYIPAAIQSLLVVLLILSKKTRKHEKIMAYVMTIATCMSSLIIISDSSNLLLLLLSAAIASLYLDKRLFLVSALVLNVGIIAKFILSNHADSNFLVQLIILNVVVLLIFFTCKWGVDIIKLAMTEEEKTKKLLEEQSNTSKIIKTNSNSLNNLNNIFK